jgi:hypothetical protein
MFRVKSILSRKNRVSRCIHRNTFFITSGLWAELGEDGFLKKIVTDTVPKYCLLCFNSISDNIYESHDTYSGKFTTLEGPGIRIETDEAGYIGSEFAEGDKLGVSCLSGSEGKLFNLNKSDVHPEGTYFVVGVVNGFQNGILNYALAVPGELFDYTFSGNEIFLLSDCSTLTGWQNDGDAEISGGKINLVVEDSTEDTQRIRKINDSSAYTGVLLDFNVTNAEKLTVSKGSLEVDFISHPTTLNNYLPVVATSENTNIVEGNNKMYFPKRPSMYVSPANEVGSYNEDSIQQIGVALNSLDPLDEDVTVKVNSLKLVHALVRPKIIFSFDVGYKTLYSNGKAIFDAAEIPFDVFAATDLIASGVTFMTWSDLAEIAEGGSHIMSHSTNVVDLTTITQVTGESIGTGSGLVKTFSGTLAHHPLTETTLEITDGVETFARTAPGVLTGSEGGAGTINSTSGAYSVTFNDAPLQDAPVTANYTYPTTVATESIGTGSGLTKTFSGTLTHHPLTALTLTITDGFETFTHTGTTVLEGDKGGTGSINVTSGAYSVTFNTGPDYGASITANYIYPTTVATESIGTGSGLVKTYEGTLAHHPLTNLSLTISDGVETLTHTGTNVMTGSLGGSGTINITTGAYSVTFNTGPAKGASITAAYTYPADISNESVGTGNDIKVEFSGTLAHHPLKTLTLTITDGVETFTHTGTNIMTGDKGGSGTINISTGDYDVTFFTAPAGSVNVVAAYTYIITVASESVGTGHGTDNFTGTLVHHPITTLTLSITDGFETFTHTGTNVMTGDKGGSGTINISNGNYDVTFNGVPALSAPITAGYVYPTTVTNESRGTGTGTKTYTGTLTHHPITTLTLAITDGFEILTHTGTNVLTGDKGGSGTINISNGDYSATFNSVPALNAPITAGYVYPTDVSAEALGVGHGAQTFADTLENFPITTLTLEITDGVETFVHSGTNVMTGDKGGTGTINITTGEYSVTFKAVPLNAASITANYVCPKLLTDALENAQTALEENELGDYNNYLSYPLGKTDPDVRDVVDGYYDGARVYTLNGRCDILSTSYNKYAVPSIVLGNSTYTVAQYKKFIDQAVAQNTSIVFRGKQVGATANDDYITIAKLTELVAYVKELQDIELLEVVHFSDLF